MANSDPLIGKQVGKYHIHYSTTVALPGSLFGDGTSGAGGASAC
jgi:hypothetical protein